MKQVKFTLKFLIYCCRFPGWLLHELSHLIVFTILKLIFWKWLIFRRFKLKVSMKQSDGDLEYGTVTTLGELLAIVISCGPNIVYVIIGVIASFYQEVFWYFLGYSALTGWFNLSEGDKTAIKIAKHSIKIKER